MLANLVEAYESCLFTMVDPRWFEEWLRPLLVRIMQKLSVTTEVGSLYRLLSGCLAAAENIGYFSGGVVATQINIFSVSFS